MLGEILISENFFAATDSVRRAREVWDFYAAPSLSQAPCRTHYHQNLHLSFADL